MKGISFSAVFSKFTTTVDGGGRLTFDFPETEMEQISEIMLLRGKVLQIGIVDINSPANRVNTDE